MMTDGVWAEISVGNQCLWLYSEHNAQGVLAPVTSEAALRTGALAIRRIYLSNGHLQNRSARRLLFYCCLRRMAITQKLSGRAKPATPSAIRQGKRKKGQGANASSPQLSPTSLALRPGSALPRIDTRTIRNHLH